MTSRKSPRTVAASNGIGADPTFGAVAPPLYLSSTFTFAGFEQPRDYDYSRAGNPSRSLLADTLAQLEGGAGAVVVASGMAAIDLVLATVECDDFVLAPHDCYGGSRRLMEARAAKGHFKLIFIDQADETALAAAMEKAPALILIETPSNPLMRVVDIRRVATLAAAIGCKVAVDNTFLSPVLQQPISLGADYVVHSTTKYLNGHSDVVGGAVIAADAADAAALSAWSNITGVTGAPFDAYLTLRGLRTLFPRVIQQEKTARIVAAYLDDHPLVTAVHYPGLKSHSGYDIAQAQQKGPGAMLSFELAGGSDAVRRFVGAVGGFLLAESLGGVESLIAHPATMTHVSMTVEARQMAGISDSLLRLSVGLEGEEDLVAGLDRGFAALG